MNICKNCGKEIVGPDEYCSNCTFKINNKEEKRIIKESFKKSQFDKLEKNFIILIIILTGLYVIISCFMALYSPKVDQSVGGLYIIFGIPIGLIMCELFPVLNLIICFNKKSVNAKNKFIVKIAFSVLTLVAFIRFSFIFLRGIVTKNIFYYFIILFIIISTILIIINNSNRSKDI